MNDAPRLVFMSGLPRSGSTLLLNLLAQNLVLHTTPTSGLIELFATIKNRWPEFVEFKAEGLERVKPRVLGALRGLLHGFFETELAAGKTVFDKSRGWLQYIEPLEETLQRPVKIVVTVRDVRAIVASFEKLYRKRGIEYREAGGEDFFQCQTTEGRARCLLGPKAVLGLTISRLRDALARGLGDRLIVVPYHTLTNSPRTTLEALHETLGLPVFAYDPENVEQVTHENDMYHGMDLHRVRSKVEPTGEPPWLRVLPMELCEWIDQEYRDIQLLCGSSHQVPVRHDRQAAAMTNARLNGRARKLEHAC